MGNHNKNMKISYENKVPKPSKKHVLVQAPCHSHKRVSFKMIFKQVIKIMLKMIPKRSTNRCKKHAKNDAEKRRTSHPKYAKCSDFDPFGIVLSSFL